MMDYNLTYSLTPSAHTCVCHFPNPTYIKRHNLLSFLFLHSPLFALSPGLWWGIEKKRIKLPGNWKGARAARDVRLLWFITHLLMRITRVCLTQCVRRVQPRGEGDGGIAGWKVVIDWTIPADKQESGEGGELCAGLWCGLDLSEVRRGCACAYVCLNVIGMQWGRTFLSGALYIRIWLI